MLVHHCTVCNYNTPVAFSASVFSQDQYCNHCAARSQGVVLRVPAVEARLSSELEAPPNDMQEEELARLFGQSLSFAAPPPNPTPPPEAVSLSPPPGDPKRASSEPIIYASAHYTHTAHIARPREASPPLSTSSHLERVELEQLLIRNSINPSLLFPSQLTLFQKADPDQRLRLLELWRISPPSYSEHETAWESGIWPETSLQREEVLASERYDRMMGARAAHYGGTGGSSSFGDAGVVMRDSSPSPQAPRTAEPYMLSGYEALANRDYEASAMQVGMPLRESTRYNQATDLAYYKAGEQEMENQYGMFQAMRQTESVTPMDDEMIM